MCCAYNGQGNGFLWRKSSGAVDMFIGGTHDPRWDDDVLHDLHSVHASDFEAVYTGDPIPY